MPTNEELAGLAAAYRAAGISLPLPNGGQRGPNAAATRPIGGPRGRRRLTLVPTVPTVVRPSVLCAAATSAHLGASSIEDAYKEAGISLPPSHHGQNVGSDTKYKGGQGK